MTLNPTLLLAENLRNQVLQEIRKNPQNIRALLTQSKSITQQVSLGNVVQVLFHLKSTRQRYSEKSQNTQAART